MPVGVGYRFQPGADANQTQGTATPGRASLSPQQVVRLLSLRIPERPSPTGIAPQALLRATGGAGAPGGGSLQSIIKALMRAFSGGGGTGNIPYGDDGRYFGGGTGDIPYGDDGIFFGGGGGTLPYGDDARRFEGGDSAPAISGNALPPPRVRPGLEGYGGDKGLAPAPIDNPWATSGQAMGDLFGGAPPVPLPNQTPDPRGGGMTGGPTPGLPPNARTTQARNTPLTKYNPGSPLF